jgi:hypothetical protein
MPRHRSVVFRLGIVGWLAVAGCLFAPPRANLCAEEVDRLKCQPLVRDGTADRSKLWRLICRKYSLEALLDGAIEAEAQTFAIERDAEDAARHERHRARLYLYTGSSERRVAESRKHLEQAQAARRQAIQRKKQLQHDLNEAEASFQFFGRPAQPSQQLAARAQLANGKISLPSRSADPTADYLSGMPSTERYPSSSAPRFELAPPRIEFDLFPSRDAAKNSTEPIRSRESEQLRHGESEPGRSRDPEPPPGVSHPPQERREPPTPKESPKTPASTKTNESSQK